jgi:ParB-like chromosome segregation protein Spo0J
MLKYTLSKLTLNALVSANNTVFHDRLQGERGYKMRVKRIITVKLADLNTNLFVRKALDQNHAFYLAELIEAGTKMKDAIEVTEKDGLLEVVDGRHRKEAYELANISDVEVSVLEFSNESEMIAYAYKRNTGGSLPPTAEDTNHTVMLLLQRKESMKHIGELLGIPVSLARKYANEVKSRMDRATMQAAIFSITNEGLNCKEASEKYGVDPKKLKDAISGKKQKQKQEGVGDIMRMLTDQHKSLGLKMASANKRLLEKYEDSDVTKEQVMQVFEHIKQLQKRHERTFNDLVKRFEGISKED